jgi:hypothetical protein
MAAGPDPKRWSKHCPAPRKARINGDDRHADVDINDKKYLLRIPTP